MFLNHFILLLRILLFFEEEISNNVVFITEMISSFELFSGLQNICKNNQSRIFKVLSKLQC